MCSLAVHIAALQCLQRGVVSVLPSLLGPVQDCLQCGSVDAGLEAWTNPCRVSLVPNTQPVLFIVRNIVGCMLLMSGQAVLIVPRGC